MTLLAEIHMGFEAAFVDDDIAVWVDDSIAAWQDGAELDLNISDENYKQEFVLWPYAIIGMDSTSYAQDTEHGGMIRPNSGSITIELSSFSGVIWPPPKTISIILTWIDEPDIAFADRIFVFDGSGFMNSIDYPVSVTYDLFAPLDKVNVLDEVEDFDGNTTALPRVFGTVRYAPCVRLPDYFYSGEWYQQYSGCYIDISKPYSIYDDGINITKNVIVTILDTADLITTSGTLVSFVLDCGAAGEVTISGTGEATDLDTVFAWATKGGVPFSGYSGASAVGYLVDRTVTQQMSLYDFLSGVCAANLFAFDVQYAVATYDAETGTWSWSGKSFVLINMRVTTETAKNIDVPSTALKGTEIVNLAPKSGAVYDWEFRKLSDDGVTYRVSAESKTTQVELSFPARR